MPDAQYARDPSDLTTILEQFERDGFTGQFAVRDDARLACLSCHTESDARVMRMEALRRMEGASDPDDMLAVVALHCPECDAKGTAVINYGPESSVDDADVLTALEDDRRGAGIDPS